MDNYNYPVGADTKDAPWNQVDNPEREIEVTVSVTLSKTVKIKVSDYQITDSGKDEDCEYFEDIDYSDCDLKGAVEEQIVLPQKAWDYIAPKSKKETQAIFDLKGWNVDDFEVINESEQKGNIMSKKAENFKSLVKGNPVGSIVTAINMLQSSTRKELMDEYKVSSVEELAFKLKQYGRQL